MANPGTRFNKVVSIGANLASFAALAASVLLYINGNVQLTGVIRFEGVPTELTQTGSTSTVVKSFRQDIVALTATGGAANGKYPIFRWQNPSTQTAAVLDFAIDFLNPASGLTIACWVNNENTTGSGSARYLYKNTSALTGTLVFRPQVTATGTYLGILVGPNEHLKCSNSQGAGNGAGLIGDGVVTWRSRR